jgi:hypothetical protein
MINQNSPTTFQPTVSSTPALHAATSSIALPTRAAIEHKFSASPAALPIEFLANEYEKQISYRIRTRIATLEGMRRANYARLLAPLVTCQQSLTCLRIPLNSN